MSGLNARRHGRDLHISDKDLLTGRDCRRLIAQALSDFRNEWDRRDVLAAAHNALPWWKRAMRGLAFRVEQLRASEAQPAPQSLEVPRDGAPEV